MLLKGGFLWTKMKKKKDATSRRRREGVREVLCVATKQSSSDKILYTI